MSSPETDPETRSGAYVLFGKYRKPWKGSGERQLGKGVLSRRLPLWGTGLQALGKLGTGGEHTSQ